MSSRRAPTVPIDNGRESRYVRRADRFKHELIEQPRGEIGVTQHLGKLQRSLQQVSLVMPENSPGQEAQQGARHITVALLLSRIGASDREEFVDRASRVPRETPASQALTAARRVCPAKRIRS